MNVNDYLIDQAGFDWPTLLAAWAEVLPETFAVWLVNRFGDVFIIAEDGSVQRLDVAVGAVDRVANSRDQFAELMDAPHNANNWLMIPLVDQCVEHGILLQPGQCYGFKTPPLFGGEYAPVNVAPVDLVENYAFLCDMWAQTKDLPDGSPIRLIVRPSSETRPGDST
ncbi:MAG: DUF1851 domain-containing protein [Ignavibacteriota bacterium]